MPDDTPQFPPDPLPTIIPGASVNLLAGAPGAGKTALMAWILTRFRDQLPLFGHQPNPVTKLAVLCGDRSWTQSTRLWFVLAGYPDIPAYSLLDDEGFNAKRLRNKRDRITILTEGIDKLDLPWGSLLFVDPLALFLGGNILDYDACAVACTEIRQLCRQRGITIIGTAHAGKQRADASSRYIRLQDRIAGSTALFGFTDTQMYLASAEELNEDFCVFRWCPHHAPVADFKLRKTKDGLFVPYDGTEGDHDLTRFAQQLLECIDISPTLTSVRNLVVLAQSQFGMSRATLYRCLEDLVHYHLVVRVGRGRVCRPKPQ